MRSFNRLILIALICVPVAILAQTQQPIAAVQRNAAFIVPGNDYHIFLPDDCNPFMYVEKAYGQKDDPPVIATIRSNIFHILELHGDSWALVEHPSSRNDYMAWYQKHRAAFRLDQPASLNAKQLSDAREAAARDIKVTETWINLNQAVIIKPVSPQSLALDEQ